MQEVPPEELEDSVQDVEEESHTEESLPSEVEELLRTLQSDGPYLDRRNAALELGNLGTSSPRILQALAVAQASDPHPDVRRAAAGSLRAPAHQEYLRRHPDAATEKESAHDQAPGKGGAGRGGLGQGLSLVRCLGASSVAGLAVGLAIGLWDADQSLFHDGGLTCGTGFLIALAVGAVVGGIVGAVVGGDAQERPNWVVSIIVSAVVSAVVAAVSWLPITVIRVVQLGGP